jgi:adenylylsulfate kinase
MEKEKLHIIPHDHKINRDDRERLLNQKAMVLWFVGLSGSGKSTIASRVEQELHQMGKLTYILDGDNVRAGLNKDLDFSETSRVENIRRIGEVSKLMVDSGAIVLSAFISPFRADRQSVRDLVGNSRFVEIHVDCPIEECEKRDVKGLYKKARAGEISNFTGISSPFEEPENPDVRVQTHIEDIDTCTHRIIEHLKTLNA